MVIRLIRFNFYFCLALALVTGLAGCQTEKSLKKRQVSTFRVHLQVSPDRTEQSSKAQVYRAQPVEIDVERTPFLTENHVKNAKVVDSYGVMALVIELDRQGAWILENYTGANPGKHYAIFCQYGPKCEFSRWLAAPVISGRITDGTLSFTPDATKEECEEITLGLRNRARKEEKLSFIE